MTVVSSIVGEELLTYQLPQQTFVANQNMDYNSNKSADYDASSNRLKTFLLIGFGLAFYAIVALIAYFSVKRSHRTMKRRNELHVSDVSGSLREYANKRKSQRRESQKNKEQGVDRQRKEREPEREPEPVEWVEPVKDDLSSRPAPRTQPDDDMISELSSVDMAWSVDGVDAQWKTWAGE
jgi:hypothetical protein